MTEGKFAHASESIIPSSSARVETWWKSFPSLFPFFFFFFFSINWQEINFDIQILVLSIEPRLNERTKRGKIIFVIFLRKTEMIAILLQLINL